MSEDLKAMLVGALGVVLVGFIYLSFLVNNANAGAVEYDGDSDCSEQYQEKGSCKTQSIAGFDKLLSPGGTSVAQKDCVEDPYQRHCLYFAESDGGDFGGDDSGGDDFGGDRAAASTAAD